MLACGFGAGKEPAGGKTLDKRGIVPYIEQRSRTVFLITNLLSEDGSNG